MRKCIFIYSALFIFLSIPAFAGDLEPTDPPDSTMNTLDHIYSQNEAIFKKLLDDNPVIVTKTGQTTSYATGDDGDLEKGIDLPSPRFTDNSDGTITDNLTGLIWLQNANCIQTHYPSFDNDVAGDSNIAGDGKVTWQHALDFVAGINSGTYPNCSGGSSDWRLPNIKELISLLDHSQSYPYLTAGHPFTFVYNEHYWTNSADSRYPERAWVVEMALGRIVTRVKETDNFYVWPVRSDN